MVIPRQQGESVKDQDAQQRNEFYTGARQLLAGAQPVGLDTEPPSTCRACALGATFFAVGQNMR